MTNPLTSLDELIWKQFEKVTQYAHKSYGRDKYDLAQVTDTGSGLMMVGCGIYSIAAGLAGSSEAKISPTVLLGTGAFVSALGFLVPYVFRRINHDKKNREMNEILRTGACRAPAYEPLRVLYLIGGACLAGYGLAAETTSNYDEAMHLAILSSGIVWAFQVSTSTPNY